MKIFHCSACENPVYFENTLCLRCTAPLAFLPDLLDMVALEPAGKSLWRRSKGGKKARTYRLCENQIVHQVCNWAVPSSDDSTICLSCRQSLLIPDLSIPGNLVAWGRMESAKRRLVYSLLALGLPVASKREDPAGGIAFHFLVDLPGVPVFTGHGDGLITINLAEADDAERERRRLDMHEPYRTLLGHFRHEVGHYYWDRLIRNQPALLESFRKLFGDETLDYASALQRYYFEGAPLGWQNAYISAYATAHPWEDWAETWAHYLHVSNTLEMAASCGMSLHPLHEEAPSLDPFKPWLLPRRYSFEKMITEWPALTHVLNNLNRGLGLPDGYPFVLSDPVVEKLRFIHVAVIGGPK